MRDHIFSLASSLSRESAHSSLSMLFFGTPSDREMGSIGWLVLSEQLSVSRGLERFEIPNLAHRRNKREGWGLDVPLLSCTLSVQVPAVQHH